MPRAVSGQVMHLKMESLRRKLIANWRNIHCPRWAKQEVAIPGDLGGKSNFRDGYRVRHNPRLSHVAQDVIVAGMIFVIVGIDDCRNSLICPQVLQGLLEAALGPTEARIDE